MFTSNLDICIAQMQSINMTYHERLASILPKERRNQRDTNFVKIIKNGVKNGVTFVKEIQNVFEKDNRFIIKSIR